MEGSETQVLEAAVAAVPAGAWAVGVSGGADSVALLSLLRRRGDLSLHVVHLDHQTRGAESSGDAEFVRMLAEGWGLPCTMALRSDVERGMGELLANVSARYRAVRMELFRRVVAGGKLQGIILAHHAGDQAETVLHRLLRGSGPGGLAGMAPEARVGELRVLRPLLGVPGATLRRWLVEQGQNWREDSSNASGKYLRNRLRSMLAGNAPLTADLLELARACRQLRQWTQREAPVLPERFAVTRLRGLPRVLAEHSARCWLAERGVPAEELVPSVVGRLLTMVEDAASPPRQHFPGQVLVRRSAGWVEVKDGGKQGSAEDADVS